MKDECTLLIYVSDDGHVRFAREEQLSFYVIEPYFSDGYKERRYKLERLRFETAADRDRAMAWVGDDPINLKWLWEKANKRDGIKLRYP